MEEGEVVKANGNGQRSALPASSSQVVLPSSEPCERACLSSFSVAAIQGRPAAVDRLLDMLGTESFFFERHQIIFEAIRRIRGRGEGVDTRTLQGELEQVGAFEVVGGAAYLAGMDLDLPDLGRVDRYAAILREREARRSLILKASEMTARGMDGEGAAELIAELQSALLEIEQARVVGGDFRPISDVILDIDPFTPRPGGMLGLSTGLADLNGATLGMQAGHLIAIAGRPSMGKTSLAFQIAGHQAVEGSRVGFVSLEDVAERLGYKILSQLAGVSHQRLALGKVTERERPKVIRAMEDAAKASLWINDLESQTVEQICAAARLQSTRHGLDALYVDYVNLLSTTAKLQNRNLEIGHISKVLKALAKSLKIPVVLLCQLKRLTPEDREPRLSDLRDSGELEQNVDAAIFVHRPEVFAEEGEAPKDPGLAHLIIDKQKTGKKGARVTVVFIGETTSFHDHDRHQEPGQRQMGWS